MYASIRIGLQLAAKSKAALVALFTGSTLQNQMM
jgi:hypothetical protein